MFAFALLLCAASTVLAQHEHHHQMHRVNVSVYYESLCPDSKKFFTQQLYPSLQGNLSEFVNLTLLPYGKTTLKINPNAVDEFDCHHGPAECFGNKIHACALNKIDQGQNSQPLGYNKNAVGFINCLMDKVVRNGDQATFPSKQCAELNHVQNLIDVLNCANHTQGSEALIEIGKKTDSLMNPLKSVPTIVFNSQYKQEDNTLAQNNFVKALCQYIHGDKPEECSRNSAGISTQISLGFIVLAGLITRYY